MNKPMIALLTSKYYDSIDNCSALLYHEILTGQKEFKALCYRGKGNNRKGEKAWEKLFNEYIGEFGLPEEYVLYTEKRIQANKLRVQGITQKPKRLLAEIRDKEAHALLSGESEKIGVTAARLSKNIGFPLDPARLTVRQFYGYLKAN